MKWNFFLSNINSILPGHEMSVSVEVGHGVLADVYGEGPHDVGEADRTDDENGQTNQVKKGEITQIHSLNLDSLP